MGSRKDGISKRQFLEDWSMRSDEVEMGCLLEEAGLRGKVPGQIHQKHVGDVCVLGCELHRLS